CCCLVVLAMLGACTTSQTDDVWRGLRWDMSIDRAARTLKRQGLKVSVPPRKTAATWISTDVDGQHAAVYFDPGERMNQITITAETITRQAADAAKERLTRRFGPVKATATRTQHTWGDRVHDAGPWSRLVCYRLEDDGWHTYEEHGAGDASGPAGVLDLAWGAAAPEVEQRLRAAGFKAWTTEMLPDPCEMPNAPPGCEPAASLAVHFEKGDEEGTAGVHKKRGLEQLSLHARVTSAADGLARAAAIAAFRGQASEIEDAVIDTWSDGTSKVELEIRTLTPGGTLGAIESYSPAHDEVRMPRSVRPSR
ncbi:MAG TPA: hypothetical protein VM733_08965, partial [Thermoanaerobaculia bacterium]|nr:hypothetical protein [Thermoanaerobaculia bacterium]